jgi:hypothetical protein
MHKRVLQVPTQRPAGTHLCEFPLGHVAVAISVEACKQPCYLLDRAAQHLEQVGVAKRSHLQATAPMAQS